MGAQHHKNSSSITLSLSLLFILSSSFVTSNSIPSLGPPDKTISIDPTNPTPQEISGAPAGLYACSEYDFQGTCHWWSPDKTSLYHCYAVPDTQWKYRSWGPDEGGACKLFHSTDCSEESRYYMQKDVHARDIWVYPGDNAEPQWEVKTIWCWKT
ncbi:hypothetical protein P280DRAFT_481984 [Massarina eburnea CBS 473.64]|uniref:Uncharacterized protein n=1 Tax=Massarina eburnea CBS 473.64 TaxID=1395130 RepID=A0A6A6RUI5_9PLEO|nr:hypothetical protein P280DRAFT_481984 [Massarina eburnea CBS 473.64]